MANVQHVDLTDPYVHEPKDITTALSGQAYIADGSSSGSWAYPKPSNWVIVEAASQFPGQGSGTITLAANTVYYVVGAINIGSDQIVFSNKSVLMATNQDYDIITSSTTGAMLVSTDVNARVIRIGLACASGTLFDVDGTGTESFDLLRVSATCDTIGDIDNMENTDIFRCGITAATAGMTFTGAHTSLEITQSDITVTATNGTCVDLGTATFNNIHLTDAEFGNPTGTGYGLDVAAAGANLNSGYVGHIVACDFTNTATASNYVEGDNGWIITASRGISPSIAKAQGYIDANGNANTFGGGVGVDEAVNFGTSFTADVQDKFTISTAGRFTYTGVLDIVVLVNASARVTMGGGSARVRNLKIAKNGTVIESSISSKELSGSAEGTYNCNSIVSLTTNDYIELYIEAETATTSTTVDTCAITMTQTSL